MSLLLADSKVPMIHQLSQRFNFFLRKGLGRICTMELCQESSRDDRTQDHFVFLAPETLRQTIRLDGSLASIVLANDSKNRGLFGSKNAADVESLKLK